MRCWVGLLCRKKIDIVSFTKGCDCYSVEMWSLGDNIRYEENKWTFFCENLMEGDLAFSPMCYSIALWSWGKSFSQQGAEPKVFIKIGEDIWWAYDPCFVGGSDVCSNIQQSYIAKTTGTLHTQGTLTCWGIIFLSEKILA